MEGRALWAAVHGVAKIGLSAPQLSKHTSSESLCLAGPSVKSHVVYWQVTLVCG